MQEDEILDVLSDIAGENHVRVLYACEAGSRAWGFASDDSDYDVRFVYIRPISEYLNLNQQRDVIERKPSDELDIVGWDIRKFLTLMRKSNPTAFEWLGSPIIYSMDNEFDNAVTPVSWRCYRPRTSAYHYAGIASSQIKLLENGDTRPKKYLYAIRGILGAKWSINGMTIPVPVKFRELWDAFDYPKIADKVENLLKIKREQPEVANIGLDHELIGWLNDQFKASMEEIKLLPRLGECEWGPFNEAFHKIAFL